MKLGREIDLVLRHVAGVIAVSDQAQRDGGQYLIGPRSYLANAEWREPLPDSPASRAVERTECVVCGVKANMKRGARWLCADHFREDDE